MRWNPMSSTESYNELEHIVLAMLGDGIQSGYAMRKSLANARGVRWSAESGSIYRVLRRLEQAGLVIQARRVGVQNRERAEYELTPQGEERLTNWLSYPAESGEFAFLIDPIRIRCRYLKRLELSEQIRVVKEWQVQSKRLVGELEREQTATSGGHLLVHMSKLNLLMQAEARHEWIKHLLLALKAAHVTPTTEADACGKLAVADD
jgi:DNA-binding PadR family transcriptional regulator